MPAGYSVPTPTPWTLPTWLLSFADICAGHHPNTPHRFPTVSTPAHLHGCKHALMHALCFIQCPQHTQVTAVLPHHCELLLEVKQLLLHCSKVSKKDASYSGAAHGDTNAPQAVLDHMGLRMSACSPAGLEVMSLQTQMGRECNKWHWLQLASWDTTAAPLPRYLTPNSCVKSQDAALLPSSNGCEARFTTDGAAASPSMLCVSISCSLRKSNSSSHLLSKLLLPDSTALHAA